MSKRFQIPMITRGAAIQPQTLNEEKRTIEVIFSTGARGTRFPWFSEPYDEELSLDPAHVRLSRLNSGAPVLNSHNGYKLQDMIGVVESALVDGKEGRAKIRLSDREDVEPIFRDIKSGIIRNISVGYRVYKYQDITPEDSKRKIVRAVDWEPLEISMVAIPFDAGAQVRSGGGDSRNECEMVRAHEFEQPEKEGLKMTEKETPEKTEGKENRSAEAPKIDVEQAAKVEEAKKEATSVEKRRQAEIRMLTRTAKLDASFADKLIDEDVSIDEARKRVINEWAKQAGNEIEIQNHISVEGSDSRVQARRDAIENSLLHRHDPRAHALTDGGREFRGMSLLEVARSCLEASGIRTAGFAKMEITKRAFHSTSDFPEVLANVAGKTLRRAYENSPRTFQPFVRSANLPDFKQVSRAALGGAPKLEKVLESGEVKRGSIGEGAEKYSLASYAKVIGITRQVIINDDLGAFTRIPEMFGREAANLEGDLVWGIFTGNPNMSDGKALFHADHGNLGTGGAVSDTTLGEMRKLIRLQTDINARRLNLVPKFLIGPAAIETKVLQFLSKEMLSAKATDVNTFKGTMEPIIEPRLDDVSATAWFAAASPDQIDIIELGYLDGQNGVYIETRYGFDVEGVEVKARLDVAAKAIDYRGLFKNAGA